MIEDILQEVKTGEGIENVLNAIIHKIRPPEGDENAPLQALILIRFQSLRGIIAYFRIMNGQIHKDDFVKFIATEKNTMPMK